MKFQNILDKYRKYSFSERDKGDRFERLMQAYLQTDPQYAYRFSNVWLWNEFPGRKDFGGTDTGIDLVARTHEGDYWAIQCKCFQASASIDKPSVDSFLSTSSRNFKDVDTLKTTGFAHRLWISTTNKWGSNAEEAIRNQNPPVSRINLHHLEASPVKWEKLEKGITGDKARSAKKSPYDHQKEASEKTHKHFQTTDRGKLIMACGTGKTYTSLQIAEKETGGNGLVLFLVPSIALLGQTLREWSADAKDPINPICICSDARITKKKNKIQDADGFSVVDLALPASTDVKKIVAQFQAIKSIGKKGMTVVFSTYQSIGVIADAQKKLIGKDKSEDAFGIFDLVICDEAHRTTGVTISGEDESAFVKVHDNDFLKAQKRLYMTATPRLYNDDSKARAAQVDAVLCSMDDPDVYGEEIYRIGFGQAVENDLLADYKVLILTLGEEDVPESIQKMIANPEREINTDDASKLIGCINALSKQILGDAGIINESDPNPMRRAVAFCQNIKVSKKITRTFNDISDTYPDSLPKEKRETIVAVSSDHIDGSMSAPLRDEKMSWLKADSEDTSECRVLTNVRCLSEGVDVPSLDAVMFLSARNSQVDVVQSVGRVMRKSPGKKYGYIIIPVVIPSDVEPEQALNDNARFRVVWTVLNALRAHDDRFNATINKIELNKSKPAQILVGTPDNGRMINGRMVNEPRSKYGKNISNQLALQFEQLQSVVFARMVQKVGDRRYWEQWAKDVAQIAERYIERINRLINTDNKHKKVFEEFLSGLQKNLNPSISQGEAVEMLSQHVITQPVFDALFEGYSFVKNNPVSISMQKMLDLLNQQSLEKDVETLQKFYDSVRKRAAGIDNAEGKQRIIVELYDKFFKTAFPKMVEQLGIVYTPVEVVDFIIHSVNDVLKKEFDHSISDKNVHVLDPFTGTGTFITRLLQSGLIEKKDLIRKYKHELHANEIVLLAYYIAAINIENAFHDQQGKNQKYIPFDGICLTDTFQLGETKGDVLFSEMFPENSKRLEEQRKGPIRVIIGNPPYSVGQKSANDNAQNQKYKDLDSRIANTYAAKTNASSKKSLYDSYIKAFRWATDRLDPETGGVLAFVSNAGWLEGNSMDGFRKTIESEFSTIYVINLRGNGRTSGERCRQEGEPLFAAHGGKGGSLTPIAICFFIKKPNPNTEKAIIHYHDIGMYLKRNQKLEIIKKFGSLSNSNLIFTDLTPNEHGDWLAQRSNLFETFIAIAPKNKFHLDSKSFFITYSLGIASARDAWVYNSSTKQLRANMIKTIDFYNQQRIEYQKESQKGTLNFKDFASNDSSNISWNDSLRKQCAKNIKLSFLQSKKITGLYRPFFKNHLYFDKSFIQRPYQQTKIFPKSNFDNLVICVSAPGGKKSMSALISNCIPDLHLNGDTQCFPLYYYEERQKQSPGLFDQSGENEYIRRDGVSDFIYERAKKQYGKNVTKEDIFYYVYGILHSPDYRDTFENDLKKILPRIPLVDKPKDFWKFSKAGRALAEIHINYESIEPHPDVEVKGAESEFYAVQKMRFPKKDQKGTIIYNSKIAISNIPPVAYEYVVNGKSAIEWIMECIRSKLIKRAALKTTPMIGAKK